MLTFMSMALLVYGSMHLYAFGKVWQAFPGAVIENLHANTRLIVQAKG